MLAHKQSLFELRSQEIYSKFDTLVASHSEHMEEAPQTHYDTSMEEIETLQKNLTKVKSLLHNQLSELKGDLESSHKKMLLIKARHDKAKESLSNDGKLKQHFAKLETYMEKKLATILPEKSLANEKRASVAAALQGMFDD